MIVINNQFFDRILIMRRILPYLILAIISVFSTLIIWKMAGMENIYKNNDGPLYVVVAKTFYKPEEIEKLKLESGLKSNYFAAHLPLYPVIIRGIREIGEIGGIWGKTGYLKAMVLSNLLTTVFLVWFFYFMVKKMNLSKSPLILSIVFLFLPRFLVVRSVGAPESLFILMILISLYFFEKEKYLLAGIFGGLSVVTKSPGILLFGGYCLVFAEKLLKTKKIDWRWLGVVLIPLGLLGVFWFFGLQAGDFFAYFKSGDNIHLTYPFSVFNFKKNWVGTAWLEEIIFYYFLYGLTVFYLKDSKWRSFFYFSLVFFVAILFVEHRDISRYSLPLWPMAMIAFEKFFSSKKFIYVFLILFLGIFFYALNFINYNLLLISDWRAYL